MKQRAVRLPGGYRVEVKGESFYLSALLELTDGDNVRAGQLPKWALLVPEPENPYDPNAIRVEIEGKPVGYLDRAAATALAPVAARLILLGVVGECMADIVGKGSVYGVFLDLGTPTACLECLQ